jgi:hypothetical protein
MPGTVQFITNRCVESQYLMRPDKQTNAIIAGSLGRALHNYPAVVLYGFLAYSNHFHMLASGPPDQLAGFVGFFSSQVARRLNKLRGRSGPFWHRRYSAEPIVDAGAEIDRLLYTLCNPVKDLVTRRAVDWPGFSTLHENTGGNPRTVKWLDAEAYSAARRTDPGARREDYEQTYQIRVARLPSHSSLGSREHAKMVRDKIAEWEQEAGRTCSALGIRPMGMRQVCKVSPTHKPAQTKLSPRPRCHASTVEGWRAYVEAYRAFCDSFREASWSFRAGRYDTRFPEHAFRPPCPAHPEQRARALSGGDRLPGAVAVATSERAIAEGFAL